MSADRPRWMAPGRSRVSTFIVVPDAMRVVRFAEQVFEAEPRGEPLWHDDGRLWNHELVIGDSTIMLGDGGPDWVRTAFVFVHVPDVHATFRRAVAAGATPMMEPDLRFYGDVDGGVEDVAGNVWWMATHVEDVAPDEIERRARAEDARRAGAGA